MKLVGKNNILDQSNTMSCYIYNKNISLKDFMSWKVQEYKRF